MYILLTLFFASLLGIIGMIGRKIYLIQNGYAFPEEDFVPDGHYFEELKTKTIRGMRTFGFVLLVIIIRLSVKISNFIQSEYKDTVATLQGLRIKKSAPGIVKTREENKFIKIVGQYKRRIRKIKEKVKEQENL